MMKLLMTDLPLTWILVVITIAFFALLHLSRSPWKRLPPGPMSFPLIGSLPFMVGDIRKVFFKMATKYGDIFTVYMGSERAIVLNGYPLIKECLLKPSGVFDARHTKFFQDLTLNLGLVGSNGKLWRDHRRYFQHFMRTFETNSLEKLVAEESSHLVEALSMHIGGSPCSMRCTLKRATANIIAVMVFQNFRTQNIEFTLYGLTGKRYDYEDKEFGEYLSGLDEIVVYIGAGNPAMLWKFLRYLPGDIFNYHKAIGIANYLRGVVGRMITEHKLATEDPPEDSLIHAYLSEIQMRQNEKDSTFSELQLCQVLYDLFAAATDTTAFTMEWLILYMILHPDIQDKVRNEIYDVIGRERPPTMKDRRQMPYTDAVISEGQRLANMIPLGLPRMTTDDLVIRNYLIPKGTAVIVNMHSMQMDPGLWPDPEKFDPGRFLDDNGRYRKREENSPFLMGKRNCAGENLAKMELFLLFTHMLQRLTFSLPDDQPRPNTEGVLGLTYQPEPYIVDINQA